MGGNPRCRCDSMPSPSSPEGSASRWGAAAEPSLTKRKNRRVSFIPLPLWLRAYAVVRSSLLSLAAILGALSILIFAAALVFGVRPVVVISGSMEPQIPVGAVVLIQPVAASEVGVGDVVTVERPRDLGLVTHRVVSTGTDDGGHTVLELKGDANESSDPEPYVVDSVGRYITHVVGLGFVTLFLQSPQGLAAAAGILIALVAIYFLDPSAVRRDSDKRSPAQV